MKKIVLSSAVAVLGLSACKKEYECCTETTTTITGSSTSAESCVTGKYTKSEVDDLEAASATVGDVTTKITCTKK